MSIVEKLAKFQKIGESEASVKKFDAAFAKHGAEFEKKIQAVCNADDLKQEDALLDCRISAQERIQKAARNSQAKIDAEAAFLKCNEGLKLQPECNKAIEEFIDTIEAAVL